MKSWLVAALGTVLLVAGAHAAQIEGWILAGSDPTSYEIVRDASVMRGGKPSGRLASTSKPKGFGTMMQCIDAADYRGKRIRFSGFVKAKDVTDWAGLWMRVDGPGSPPQTLAFDNMQGRPIKGTLDFVSYNVVLDIGTDAAEICFGILLSGEGTVWLNSAQFEPVPTSVPVTNNMSLKQSKAPKNLGFDH
jgi:hypothetical protein